MGQSLGQGGTVVDVYKDRGVFIVAYGHQAHDCAYHLIRTIHKYSPSYPVCLVSEGFKEVFQKPNCRKDKRDETLEPSTNYYEVLPEAFRKIMQDTDVHVPDVMTDRRARGQKTSIWKLAPSEWKYVLYLDADILVSTNLDIFFQVLEDGWDMVLTLSPPQGPLIRHAQRAKYKQENSVTDKLLHGNHWLQPSGGVWSFARNERTEAYLALFHKEWKLWQHTDQQSMIRAMYMSPVKAWTLGTEWNTFMHHADEAPRSVGIRHFATAARSWTVKHAGRSLWRKWSKKL